MPAGRPRWFELVGSDPARERTARSLANDGSMIVRKEERIFLRVGWKHVRMVSGKFIGEGDTKLVEMHMPPNQYLKVEHLRKPTLPTAVLTFGCNVCKARFATSEELIKHIEEVHAMTPVPGAVSSRTGNESDDVTLVFPHGSDSAPAPADTARIARMSHPWTKEEDEYIAGQYVAGTSAARIFYPGRTSSAIQQRLSYLRTKKHDPSLQKSPPKELTVPPPGDSAPAAPTAPAAPSDVVTVAPSDRTTSDVVTVKRSLAALLDDAVTTSLELSILLEEVKKRVAPLSELLKQLG